MLSPTTVSTLVLVALLSVPLMPSDAESAGAEAASEKAQEGVLTPTRIRTMGFPQK